MRRYGWVMAATALVAALGGTAAFAEMNINGPAEVPPQSWKGRQYVDSAGCVFVRAGYGGTVNWVPRVNRNKSQLCGYQPTFKNGEAVLDVARSAPATVTPKPAAPAAPAAVAQAPAPVAAAKPAVVAAAPVARPVAPPVRLARPAPPSSPRSPFAPTPFVGAPMATIALTDTPPRIGLGAAAAATVSAAPVRVASAPVAIPAAVPVAVASRSGYVSPYAIDGGAGMATAAPRGSVRYHNSLPLPGEAAAVPVSIVGAQTVAGSATSCPAGTQEAQRYRLSDGRSVVRCGAQTANPADFINAAAVPGLVVGGTAPLRATAPLVGGNGYAVAADLPGYGTAPTAPMVGGSGYAISYSSQAMAPAAAGMTPQQNYAAASPYQAMGGAQPYSVRASASSYAAPAAVTVRSRSGLTTLAPLVVSTQVGPTGYAAAFDDGRLNPYRGPRTAWGDAQQGEIWTNQVPSRPVTDKTPARKRIVPVQPITGPDYSGYIAPAQMVRVSSKSVPVAQAAAQPVVRVAAQPQAAGPRYVQVGSFAMPGNAAAAKARLSAAGLPVASSTTGRGLTVVLAGPFADARGAMASVRAAGFGDAILR